MCSALVIFHRLVKIMLVTMRCMLYFTHTRSQQSQSDIDHTTTDQVKEILEYLIVDAGPRDNIDKVIFIVGPESYDKSFFIEHYLAACGGIKNDIAHLTLFQSNVSQGTVFVDVPTDCDLSRFFLEYLPLSVQILDCYFNVDKFDIRPEAILQNLNAISRLQLNKNTSMVRFKYEDASQELDAFNKIRNIQSNYKFSYKVCKSIQDCNDQQERSQFMTELMKSENFVKLHRTTKRQDNWIRYQLEIKKMSIDDIIQKYQYSDLEDGVPYLSKVRNNDYNVTRSIVLDFHNNFVL